MSLRQLLLTLKLASRLGSMEFQGQEWAYKLFLEPLQLNHWQHQQLIY